MPRRVALLLTAFVAAVACSSPPDNGEPQVRRETRGPFILVWLAGTPYEMGQQQALLLREEMRLGMEMVDNDIKLRSLLILATELGLVDVARDNSFPEMLEECQGMVEGARDIGWTMDKCLVLNFGDVILDFLTAGRPEGLPSTGCAQIAAAGEASADGRLYHARLMDWARIQYLLDFPIIFVRQPEGGIPHATIGFPGNLSPYQGLNAEGIVASSNEIVPRDRSVNAPRGRSHVQLIAQLLAKTRSLDEVRAMVADLDDMSTDLILVSDGETQRAEVMEMAPSALGIRPLSDGVVYATNHFMAPETDPLDRDPPREHSTLRADRLDQLVSPGGRDTRYAELTPETLVAIMRDRTDPYSGEQSPPEDFDNGRSLATNGSLYGLLFDPERLDFWVAAGKIPVPQQPFWGFNLGELLDMSGYASPQIIP